MRRQWSWKPVFADAHTSVSSLRTVALSSDVFLSLVPFSISSSSNCLSASHSLSDRSWARCVCFSRLSWTTTNFWVVRQHTELQCCVHFVTAHRPNVSLCCDQNTEWSNWMFFRALFITWSWNVFLLFLSTCLNCLRSRLTYKQTGANPETKVMTSWEM